MTNSPPSNVKLGKNEPCRVLASGVDWLTLSLQVEWSTGRAFELLAGLKELAKREGAEHAHRFAVGAGSHDWLFTVKPHGKDGYEWLLGGQEMAFKIGNWQKPKQRPSVMVDLRSEMLWMHGPDAAVNRALQCINALEGKAISVKSSRTDLCVDVILARDWWINTLHERFVTRARDISPRLQRRVLSGFTIGKSLVSARLYDKPLEIATQSGKTWMYDVWGLQSVAPEYVIVRTEFQVRRQRLKEFECNSWLELREKLPALWARMTRKWLRVVDDASLHHTQQTPLPWWDVISSGFKGAQGAEPLVRKRAINFELRRQAAQVLGGLNSIVASITDEEEHDLEYPLDTESYCRRALEVVLDIARMDEKEFTRRVIRKQALRQRSLPGFKKNQSPPTEER